MAKEETRRKGEAELPSLEEREERKKWRERERLGLEQGQVVLKGKDIPYQLLENAYGRLISMPWMIHTATDNMYIFGHKIPIQSGRHRHQGAFAIFVVEGKGYTTLDGVRQEWEEGDLLLIPIKPGGVEHQHFNSDPSKPARWIAVQSRPMIEMLSRRIEETEVHPDWKKAHGEEVVYFEDKLASKKSD